ncbi:MAG: TetR family transcriptional regulator [Peptococcaceae bacterium]|jgi:probable dihydroxyacetone kinase regulator|nr:TetR family transcriptional regulator [Peptococcaceae bacterium]
MPDSQLTKRALAQAMKEAMSELPLEKIRIKDIVKRCNMNRQSFYYHFKDKYDLVNWIFYTEFFADIRDYLDEPNWELLGRICEFFYENREFYRNALQVTGQNSFYDYFVEVLYSIFIIQFNEIFKEDPNRDFYATFLADAIRAAICRWLLQGDKVASEEFVKLIKNACEKIATIVLKI